jgi:AcrR family transcriptional regulator
MDIVVEADLNTAATRYKPGDAKLAEIINVARDVIMTTGFDGMTISYLAQKVGMTRSLFYHYFANKDAVAQAVLDDEISQYLKRLKVWNDKRILGGISEALDDIVDVFFDTVSESSLFHRKLINTGNASLYIKFMDKVADEVSDFIGETAAKDFAQHHNMPITHVHETFYMMTVGLTSYIRSHPSADKASVRIVVAQTLHLEEFLTAEKNETRGSAPKS